jgi:SagB-type dehydrogenase family enzyme
VGGIRDKPSGRRTAPTASNRQEIDVYVALAEGLYLYDHKAHRLEAVVKEDLRAATGGQEFAATAAVNLVFVADHSRMRGSQEDKVFYSATDTGYVSQNVYLFCASEGLATVARGSMDRPALSKAMKLNENQHITLAQSVGYPAR